MRIGPINAADYSAEVRPEMHKNRLSTISSMRGEIWMSDDFDAPLDFTSTGKPVKFGGWEGKITMADEFDAPLDDFEEYM